ncbi:DEAD/DEAH box helicase [groundwater metagenome]
MSLNPIETTNSISERYLSYLSTAFHLKNPDLQSQFIQELRPEKFIKGPILEATPPFEAGKTIDKLIDEGLLSAQFKELKCEEFPLNRSLYKHQENAIHKLNQEKHNIVVATGTGSGKTEVFIVTILNYLFRQKEKSELRPGVRALLLYPMNALVNDQLARMRALLKNYPDITFGRYTGETEESQKDAEEKYRKINKNNPLPNELISREQMRYAPPHILLTNYAMLEYLLLRPNDNVFFDGEYAKNWKFIVIDEAHTYNGAKGIEMAMLLRRLKDRVVKSEQNRIQCIATSATLGGGIQDDEEVSRYAKELFGEAFDSDDVIQAVRKKVIFSDDEKARYREIWANVSPSIYEDWQKILNDESTIDNKISALIESGKKNGILEHILEKLRLEAANDHIKFLYNILKMDEKIASVRAELENGRVELEKGSQPIDIISRKVFPDVSDPRKALVALVDLAVKAKSCKDEAPLIPARYHLFVRAIEGAYLSLYPEKKIFLERHETVQHDGREYPVFEIAACRQCGAAYLVGETEKGEKSILRQPGKQYFEDVKKLEYYLLLDEYVQTLPDNEDELVDFAEETKGEPYRLCCTCGAIDKDTLVSSLCDCKDKKHITVIKVASKNGEVHKCEACARTNTKGSIVWRFLLGKDAIASVLATSLYQQIPVRKSIKKPLIDDGWSSRKNTPDEKKDKRRLLIFSDSRQDAAFFAPYLSHTYFQILRRKLILKTIEENKDNILRNKWRVNDLSAALKHQIYQQDIYPKDTSQQVIERTASNWVLYELLSIDSKIGLDGLGLLGFSLCKLENWQAPSKLKEPPWNLSDSEVWILYQILLDSFRKNGAVSFPNVSDPKDDFFKPKNREYFFRENISDNKKHILSWNSSEHHDNARLDFLKRFAQKIGIDQKECSYLLKNIWRDITEWRDYFNGEPLKDEGVVYRIRYNLWELQPYTINNNIQWYFCEKCNNLTLFNLKDVCPTYRCDGTLQKCNPDNIFADNHYRNLYLNTAPVGMRVEEHTAQLTSETAAEYQRQFIEGDINVLSCSTTFELGVDIGELECVYLRNVPPSAANYIQRAGRAGRRTDSTAFVLTFCQRRSHDLSHFNEPERLVSGKVKPPHFEIKNEKIILRHIYATALAKFWREHEDMFENVEAFFFNKNGTEMFKDYLSKKPEDIFEILQRIVPENFHHNKEINLKEWIWVEGLLHKEKGVLQKATDEVLTDVDNLEKMRERLFQEKKDSYIPQIKRTIDTIKGKSLINFLSSHNVIPKYGFPVDVVEMQILHHSEEGKKLELNRDLRIALSEYAPGSEIIAGGKKWTSRYLKRVPQREWPTFKYAICDYCQRYNIERAQLNKTPEKCESCGNSLQDSKNQGTFIIPEFGFIVSNDGPQEPGDEHRERTYSTRTYYSGESEKNNELTIEIKNKVKLYAESASHGKMAIINSAGRKGFKVCSWCGYTVFGNEKVNKTHPSPWKSACSGKLQYYHLGHEFMTDILQLRFEGCEGLESDFLMMFLEEQGMCEG